MYYWLKALFTPGCWIQLGTYSPDWDAELNRLLMEHQVERTGNYTARIGRRVVWIENHPYASFRPNDFDQARPKRATILKAWDRLIRDGVLAHNVELRGDGPASPARRPA
jgi:hypothetical protein